MSQAILPGQSRRRTAPSLSSPTAFAGKLLALTPRAVEQKGLTTHQVQSARLDHGKEIRRATAGEMRTTPTYVCPLMIGVVGSQRYNIAASDVIDVSCPRKLVEESGEGGRPSRSQRRERPKPFHKETFESARAYIVRCDGVLWEVMDISNGRSAESLQRGFASVVNRLIDAGKRLIFLATHPSRRKCFERLTVAGIKIESEECILTVGSACTWYLKSLGVKKPWILTASAQFLQDLRVGFPASLATINTSGETIHTYRPNKFTNDCNVAEITESDEAFDVDAVVFDSDPELSHLKLGVSLRFAQRRRSILSPIEHRIDQQGENEPGNTLADDIYSSSRDALVPMVSICGPATRMSVREFEEKSSEKGAPYSMLLEGVDIWSPSAGIVQQILKSPCDKAGFGIDFRTSVLVGASVADIEFANRCGMRSLLVSRDATLPVVGPNVAYKRRPTWVLPTLADI